MPKKGKGGRRPRFRTPMPRATFTASTDEMALLMLNGDGILATGVQRLIAGTVASDENMSALLQRARPG